MDKFILLLILLNVVHSGTCKEEVLVLKYNRENNCQDPNVGVPIEPNSVIREFTFCGKYKLKFLRRSTFMSLGSDIYFELFDFDAKKFILFYDDRFYFFDFQTEKLKPTKWQHICFALSMSHIKVVINGVSNEVEDFNLVTKETQDTTLWFGVDKTPGINDHNLSRLVGTMTDIHLWNVSLGIDALTSITLNGKKTDAPLPDLFMWPPLDAKSNMPCYEYLNVDENDGLLQNDPPEEIMLIENHENFASSNYLCQAYGGNLFIPKNDGDLSKLTSLIKESNCSYSYLGL